MSYRLDDVKQRHREAPNSFSMPREQARCSLALGEIVSVGIYPEPNNAQAPEWLWVRVENARPTGMYIGVLLDSPKNVPVLAAGNRIEFGPDNVAEIYIEEGDERWFDASKLAMVSGHVAHEGAWPGRLMRIPPMSQEYSGWLIFSGAEPPAYIKDFSNFTPTPLLEVLGLYPNIATVLASPVSTEWNWDADAAEYR
jgi:hypothetical protein